MKLDIALQGHQKHEIDQDLSKEIEDALKRIRKLCSQLGLATLTAEVFGVSEKKIHASLLELALAAERTLGSLVPDE